MSSFKTFAVAGGGNIGAYIAKELLKQRQAGKVTDIVLLTRSSSKNETVEKLAAEGARIAAVDYTSEDSLIAAFRGVDAGISTIPNASLQSQPLLISAAKKAGVRLFLPPEFEGPTDKAEEGPLKAKRQSHLQLKELGFSHTWQYAAKTGKKIDVTYQSLAELQAALKANPRDIASFLHATWAQGGGVVGKPEEVSDGLYPDWNPKKVIDVLAPQ